jgi:hypothetical protein
MPADEPVGTKVPDPFPGTPVFIVIVKVSFPRGV